MLNRNDLRITIAELRRVDLLNALSDDELGVLASAVKSRRFDNGEVLMHEGDESDRLYILRKGKLEAYARGEDGAPKHILEITDSSHRNFFGEIALLTGGKRKASIRATTDVEVWDIGRDDLARLFRDRPLAGALIAEEAEARLTEISPATSAATILLTMRKVFGF